MEITSRDNESFKELLKLTQKKHRRARGVCIVEGEKIIRDLKGIAKQVFIRKSKVQEFSFENSTILDDKLFNLVTSLETDPGVLAIVSLPKSKEISFPYLMLDRIQDAGNMGTILRTAAAFGFKSVICINCVDTWSSKVLRSGAGMQFSLNITETDYGGFEQLFQKELRGSLLVCADLGGGDLDKVAATVQQVNNKFGLVLGNEGQGIGEEIKKYKPLIATIPMSENCESLNVAVAGGILMYKLKGVQK